MMAWLVVLGAAVIGCLVGYLFGRRLRVSELQAAFWKGVNVTREAVAREAEKRRTPR